MFRIEPRKKTTIERGDRFTRLVVLRLERSDGERRWWRCRCDCGKHKVVPTRQLTSLLTKSCGCLQSENGAQAVKRLNARVA